MEKFVQQVNRIIECRFGFGVHDFADFPFFNYFEDSIEEGTTEYSDMVNSCAEDFIFEVESEYNLGGVL